MRQPLIFFLLLAFLCLPAAAQTDNAAPATVYEIADVGADVTADSAVHARDQAIMQAQRSAFQQLLGRLGADSAMAKKLDDDGIAALVQNFEVQDEHTSRVRYIGTFTVQFKPNAVREWLDQNGTTYTETPSAPVVVVPVVVREGRLILWEEPTAWRAAWEQAHEGGLVPLAVPTGEIDDVAVISAQEAVSGNADALKALMAKYQAGGAAVVTLTGDAANPKDNISVTITRYDDLGNAEEPVHLSLPPAAAGKGKNGAEAALAQAVRQVRAELENNRLVAAPPAAPSAAAATVPSAQSQTLPVTVPLNTLADWTLVKRKLGDIRAISRVSTVSLQRSAATIEIEFRGNVEQLEAALAQQNLSLSQEHGTGGWVLESAAPGL